MDNPNKCALKSKDDVCWEDNDDGELEDWFSILILEFEKEDPVVLFKGGGSSKIFISG